MADAQPVAIEIAWRPRDTPLSPMAAAATGPTAIEIVKLLLELDDESLALLKGAAGPSEIILLGESQTLPWVDGVVYLGRDPAAPTFLLPTNLAPNTPLPLFEKAIRSQFANLQTPLVVLPGCKIVSSVAAARNLDREAIRSWLEGKAP